jgi:hypothetical protein
MARMRKERRQQRGSAWHWKQTDSWYDTPPGTKKRIPLFDEQETVNLLSSELTVGDVAPQSEEVG